MKKVMLGFMAGLAVGILYAPSKGKNTRRRVADIADNMKGGWDTLTDLIADKVNAGEEEARDQYPSQPKTTL